MSRGDECNSCGAHVTWARNDKTGKAAPLDALPNERGNVVLLGLQGGEQMHHVLTKADRAERAHEGRQRFTSHFATCPNGKQHRRG